MPKSGGCVRNIRTHELVPKIRRLVFATHELTKSRTRAKMWRLCLQHTNSRTRAKNQAACVDNTRTHELVPKSRGCVCNTRTHELVPKIRRLVLTTHELTNSRTRAKIRRLCLQHMNARTHEHMILRKRCGARVCCINSRSQELTLFPEKEAVRFACYN